MEKMKQNYVLTKLISTTTSFDLWMFKGAHDMYNFVGFYWQPKQMTIGLFETIEITYQALVNKLIELFDRYGLKKNHYICGSNLNIVTITLKFIERCEVLGLDESFQSICSSQGMLICYYSSKGL
jgi:hypothetical protein